MFDAIAENSSEHGESKGTTYSIYNTLPVVCMPTITSAGLTMGPMGHVSPTRGAPEQKHSSLDNAFLSKWSSLWKGICRTTPSNQTTLRLEGA